MNNIIATILKYAGLEGKAVIPLKGATSSYVFRAWDSVFRIHILPG